MGFRVTIGDVVLDDTVVESVEFSVISPENVDAKGAITSASLKITGKILNTSGEKTVGLASWAADDIHNGYEYKNVVAQYIHDSTVLREYTLPNAFAVDYSEEYGDNNGSGTFTLLVNQKKQHLKETQVNGGYGA